MLNLYLDYPTNVVIPNKLFDIWNNRYFNSKHFRYGEHTFSVLIVFRKIVMLNIIVKEFLFNLI